MRDTLWTPERTPQWAYCWSWQSTHSRWRETVSFAGTAWNLILHNLVFKRITFGVKIISVTSVRQSNFLKCFCSFSQQRPWPWGAALSVPPLGWAGAGELQALSSSPQLSGTRQSCSSGAKLEFLPSVSRHLRIWLDSTGRLYRVLNQVLQRLNFRKALLDPR